MAAILASPPRLYAETDAPTWEPTGLVDQEVGFVLTPAGGALLAGRREYNESAHRSLIASLWRSHDDGDTWREVNLPPDAYIVRVDPADPDVMLAAAGPTLYRTTDGGTTWTPIVSGEIEPFTSSNQPVALAISPADHQLVYLALRRSTSVLRLLRSHDGGITWEKIKDDYGPSPSCAMVVNAFQPHPTDPDRVLAVIGCSFFGDDVSQVSVSTDQGTTWTRRGGPGIQGTITGLGGLYGWEGAMPERLYATTRHSEIAGPGKQTRTVGRSLFRSDDEGQTWTLLLTTVPTDGHEDRLTPVSEVGFLENDPAHPDTVYLYSESGIQVSTDAGQSWATLHTENLPRIRSVSLGVDGRTLYAATEGGLYRLRLES